MPADVTLRGLWSVVSSRSGSFVHSEGPVEVPIYETKREAEAHVPKGRVVPVEVQVTEVGVVKKGPRGVKDRAVAPVMADMHGVSVALSDEASRVIRNAVPYQPQVSP